MALTAGIVGLPNVGKSTLFNAITKKNILAANYPFATIEPNVGVVLVPDERLDNLVQIYNPEKVVNAAYEFIDIAGLVKGASKGEGLGNKFLSHIKNVDAICEVVRCFEDENIIHVDGNVDPIRDIETINIELILSDLEIIESRIERIEKKAKTTKDKDSLFEFNTLDKIRKHLEEEKPIRTLDLLKEEQELIKNFSFLTAKPMIYLANISEDGINKENKYVDLVKEYAKKENSEVVVICTKVESELVELSDEDKKEYLKELGIEESALDKLIKATYSLLGLETYITAGPKEVKAWTYKKGMTAPECAGVIHSDFGRGFIRAEVIKYNDLVNLKSEKAVKEAGKMNLEGKDYIMQDGDVCHFRFNV